MNKIDTNPQFAICINNKDYPVALSRHKIYQILPDAEASLDNDLRVIDESGEDYLYPSTYFIPIDLPLEVKEILLQTAYL